MGWCVIMLEFKVVSEDAQSPWDKVCSYDVSVGPFDYVLIEHYKITYSTPIEITLRIERATPVSNIVHNTFIFEPFPIQRSNSDPPIHRMRQELRLISRGHMSPILRG